MMRDTDLRGAYSLLKFWYCHTYARDSNPFRADMAKVTKEYTTRYLRKDPKPLSRLVATRVEPFQINDEVP